MSLLDEYSHDFLKEVRARGRDDYRRGAVEIIGSTSSSVSSRVDSTQRYRVRVEWDPEEGAKYECTCPYFEQHGDPCKHAWATVLKANAAGVLPRPPGMEEDADELSEDEADADVDPAAAAVTDEASGNDEAVAGDETPDEAPAEAADPYDEDDDLITGISASGEETPDPEDEPALEGEEDSPFGPPLRGAANPATRPAISAQARASLDAARSGKPVDPMAWKRQLSKLTETMRVRGPAAGGPGAASGATQGFGPNRRVIYVIDKPATLEGNGLTVELAFETMKRDGRWEKPRPLKVGRDQVALLPDDIDRQIVQMLLGARRGDYGYYGYYDSDTPRRFELPVSADLTTLRLMCQTGRARLRISSGEDHPRPLSWDDGPAWDFWLEVRTSPGGRYFILDGSLRRAVASAARLNGHSGASNGNGDVQSPEDPQSLPQPNGASDELTVDEPGDAEGEPEPEADEGGVTIAFEPEVNDRVTMRVAEPDLLVRGGLCFWGNRVARLDDRGAFDLLVALREGSKISVPIDQRDELMRMLFALPRLPRLDLPEGLHVVESHPTPRPRLTVKRPSPSKHGAALDERLVGTVSFDYAGQVVSGNEPREVIVRSSAPALAAEILASRQAAVTAPMTAISAEPPAAVAADSLGDTGGIVATPALSPPEPPTAEPAEAADAADAADEAAVVNLTQIVYRDLGRENECYARLLQLGFREAYDYGSTRPSLRLGPSKLPRVVAELSRDGWFVEAEGKLYRPPGEFKVSVTSGIDWFELHGEVQFGDQIATLPQLLSALRRGQTTVRLGDGTFGLLPQEWLKKYAPLAGMGEVSRGEDDEDHLRFSARQVGFLDALLAGMPEARFDAGFTRARDELARFSGVAAIDAPATFVGELRAYQRDGLGWMSFLRRFGFGGCLADDMGLGKTVQVLALLESRRRLRRGVPDDDAAALTPAAGDPASALATPAIEAASADTTIGGEQQIGPSLVVAPRSLVFNWMQEAAKFTPRLRVLDHTQADRQRGSKHFMDYDLVLTTYGTLRRDAGYFKDIRFDYAVLDEAQAIKNASSESAKAARLLAADHRLALSGTPVQNHLGELWSLFEFLNPGMMGTASVFREVTGGTAGSDAGARESLSRALRPFILRRTKEQVARDLPEKTEQTLFCELDTEQRRLYNELRDHYRTSLLDRIAKEGMNKAKIQVLEALLRLRQAACHPGLIDKKKASEGSAKLDTLLEQVGEVLEENHKVLVFSQFTTLLAIVRSRLDQRGVVYEYLDGRTRDRQARVERFQNDPDCKLFLISLKAGGLGLNLTAAEYVFLLDPWWNPAVEAQAIDRAHRIGQTRRVFAYRLIAKDTVEEKVLQLQQTKKDLAAAIINADNSLIRTLKRDDLELLLS